MIQPATIYVLTVEHDYEGESLIGAFTDLDRAKAARAEMDAAEGDGVRHGGPWFNLYAVTDGEIRHKWYDWPKDSIVPYDG